MVPYRHRHEERDYEKPNNILYEDPDSALAAGIRIRLLQ